MYVDLALLKAEPSETLTFAKKAKGVEFNFGGGDAVTPIPPEMRQAGVDFWQTTDLTLPYPPQQGLPGLREAYCAMRKREFGAYPASENVLVTHGGKGAIFLFFLVLGAKYPGGVVLLFKPYWPSFASLAKKAGLQVVAVEENHDGSPDFNSLETLLKRHGHEIVCSVVNFPRNPDGMMLFRRELERIVALVEAHAPGSLYLADEVYEQLLHRDATGQPERHFVPFQMIAPKERVLRVTSISKFAGCAGERVGFAEGPTELIEPMADYLGDSLSGVSLGAQAIALAAMSPAGSEFARRRMAEMTIYRDEMWRWGQQQQAYTVRNPYGTIYGPVLLGPQILGRRLNGNQINTAKDFSMAALRYELAAMYFNPNLLRFNLAQVKDLNHLRGGLAKLDEIADLMQD